MNDHDALLNAIAEHPEEDTPRLMYADWLEENGQPERADFVRNQIELERVGLNGEGRHPLVVKNVHYLKEWVPYWKSELPRIKGIEWGDFNRGLVEEVYGASDEPVVAHADTIFAVPGIHVLRVRRLNNAAALAQLPHLARVRALKMVSAGAGVHALRTLLASPHLGRLTALDLHRNGADDAVAEDIADGRFPDLAELWLGENLITQRGARALATSPHLTNLRFLDLYGNRCPYAHHALRKRFGSNLKL
jgi:uncharacterized protein (TIGR02996 family)